MTGNEVITEREREREKERDRKMLQFREGNLIKKMLDSRPRVRRYSASLILKSKYQVRSKENFSYRKSLDSNNIFQEDFVSNYIKLS